MKSQLMVIFCTAIGGGVVIVMAGMHISGPILIHITICQELFCLMSINTISDEDTFFYNTLNGIIQQLNLSPGGRGYVFIRQDGILRRLAPYDGYSDRRIFVFVHCG